MIYAITIAVFALAYAVKGGAGAYLKNWNKVRHRDKILHFLMDGKIASALMVFIFMLAATANTQTAALFAIGWIISVAPSMGEEHGAVGRWGKAWGDYIEKGFGRSYGVKKAVQRGIFIGAVMAALTGFIPFIWASLAFVPCVFVGQQLSYWIFKKDGWILAEPLIGAIVFGVPSAMYLTA